MQRKRSQCKHLSRWKNDLLIDSAAFVCSLATSHPPPCKHIPRERQDKKLSRRKLMKLVVIGTLGCPPKLVSYRNNRNWNRNQFWHYPKQDVCLGCFALISKQGVSMFRSNRNKQKTNRSSSIFVKIQPFNSPYQKLCSFRLFRYRSETPKQTENNRNRLIFGLFRFEPRKKLTVSRTPNRKRFLEIFSVHFGLF